MEISDFYTFNIPKCSGGLRVRVWPRDENHKILKKKTRFSRKKQDS
jgi:hypothetical protein